MTPYAKLREPHQLPVIQISNFQLFHQERFCPDFGALNYFCTFQATKHNHATTRTFAIALHVVSSYPKLPKHLLTFSSFRVPYSVIQASCLLSRSAPRRTMTSSAPTQRAAAPPQRQVVPAAAPPSAPMAAPAASSGPGMMGQIASTAIGVGIGSAVVQIGRAHV